MNVKSWLDRGKEILTGETITTHVYSNDTPFEDIIKTEQAKTLDGKELTELEFFDERGKRVHHWKKYR